MATRQPIDKTPSDRLAESATAEHAFFAWRLLAVVCVLVVAVYAYMARSGVMELLNPNPAESYYNLLVDGFRAGQLSLKKEVPPGLARLADPYNPVANAPFRLGADPLHDLSYYKGRLYFYFGVTPALILFWPFVALTGDHLFQSQAVVIFCTIGFFASVALLYALWRRYFSEISAWVVAACALALGLATGVPLLLPRSSYNEVAVSCGYMLTMLALTAIWRALHESKRQCWWLAAASVAYGLAVGARPNLLFGAVILLVPVVQAWGGKRHVWSILIAAIGPIALIGLGLMLYNDLRFDNPFEFGMHYQLAAVRSVTREYFDLHFLWFNFRVYFLEPAHWSAHFPFVHEIAVPPLPAGYGRVERPFGVLTNIPLVWLSLAAPLAWRGALQPAVLALRCFVTALALCFAICVLPLLFLESAIMRYEVDFLPALLLLAVIGIFGLERALTPTSESGQVNRPILRRTMRWTWGVLLIFSVAFNLLASVGYYAFVYNDLGNAFFQQGRVQEASRLHEQALRLDSDYAEAHNSLALDLFALGKAPEGSQHFERSLQLRPNQASTHYDWGNALAKSGKLEESVSQYQQALRLKPEYPDARNNLGLALMALGKPQEAIEQYEWALRIDPDYPQAHNSLGNARLQQGRVAEAIAHYETALHTWPDSADLHYNLGFALEKLGRTTEAIVEYQRVLSLRPDFAAARNALTRLGAGQ